MVQSWTGALELRTNRQTNFVHDLNARACLTQRHNSDLSAPIPILRILAVATLGPQYRWRVGCIQPSTLRQARAAENSGN
jgi:hypothetical protein